MATKNKISLIIITLLFFPLAVFSASYDFYVDGDYDGDEDGSKDKPFNTIGEAAAEAEEKGGTNKIYIENGQYDEKVTLGKRIKLYGQSASGVVIKKTMAMKDGSSIKDLTISGGTNAIDVEAEANVEIDNCRLKNFSRIGVNAWAGGGEIKIKNSSIYDGGTKGMYIQAGRRIELVGNLIYDNNEEGIDIRARVKGTIEGNEVYGNGESGIELVVGGSEVAIKDNKIQKNGSSGIAVQFYSEDKQKGAIKITGNTIARNKKYGLDCGIPSGGSPKSGYWNSSVELIGNVIDKNSVKPINPYCGFIEAVDEAEEKTNVQVELTAEEKKVAVEETLPPVKTPEELEAERLKVEEEKLRRQQQQKEEADAITLELSNAEEENIARMEGLTGQNKLMVFFIGYDKSELALIKINQEKNREKIGRLQGLLYQTDNEGLKEALQESIDEFSQIDQKETLFIKEKENVFNLKSAWDDFWGFFFK